MTAPARPIGDEELARLRGEVKYALRPEHRNSVVVFPLWDVAALLARLDAAERLLREARNAYHGCGCCMDGKDCDALKDLEARIDAALAPPPGPRA